MNNKERFLNGENFGHKHSDHKEFTFELSTRKGMPRGIVYSHRFDFQKQITCGNVVNIDDKFFILRVGFWTLDKFFYHDIEILFKDLRFKK